MNKEVLMQGLSGQQVGESKAKYGTNELANPAVLSQSGSFSFLRGNHSRSLPII